MWGGHASPKIDNAFSKLDTTGPYGNLKADSGHIEA
jgi:hypothetical protein